MTPADRRVTELIDKWIASIDLHLQYVELSDAAYARAQAWPKHDRPTRWVLEVARQKVLELKAQCETRQAMGDGKFSESLELMSFLANLVGIQHIQRFIPLADPSRTDTGPGASQTVEAPTIIKPPPAQRARPAGDETTREMPRLKTPAAAKPAAPAARQAPPAKPSPAPSEAKARGDGAKAPTRAPSVQARPTPPHKTVAAVDLKSKIIADAVRLLKWGKSWHELAELIARIADRPPEAEIRKFLRASKNEIEKAAQS